MAHKYSWHNKEEDKAVSPSPQPVEPADDEMKTTAYSVKHVQEKFDKLAKDLQQRTKKADCGAKKVE